MKLKLGSTLRFPCVLASAAAFLISTVAHAAESVPAVALARLPIKEVTVFKDGHAFVLHEGSVPADNQGTVVMDYLPRPVVGTFWTYSADKSVRLASVTAGQRRASIERTALTLRELIEGNIGADALITETNQNTYAAILLGVPERSPQELDATSPPNSVQRLPERGDIVLLKTAEGTRVVPLERIQEITFKNPPQPKTSQEEFRDYLTLKFEGTNGAPVRKAEVGLVYLQKGIRWIPSYKVDLDGKGKANVKLQATVVNELADLENVTLQLVIGVPSFKFKDTLDPMAVQQTVAQLSQFFQSDRNRFDNNGQLLAANFSNAIMSQQAQVASPSFGYAGGSPGAGISDVDLPEGARNEDLFVFTLRHVSLKRGERAVLPLAEVTVAYQDVYTLDLPFTPPNEWRNNFNTQQQAELARLFSAPKVMHKVRLSNSGKQPFTTAPALLLDQGRVVSQSMMTYAAVGASADLEVTAAVDIQVKKTDNETGRKPNAININGSQFTQVDLDGQIRLTSHRPETVKVEVTRHALGKIDQADSNGDIQSNNVFESSDFLPVGGSPDSPPFWTWYNWPYWWNFVNGVGRVTWTLELPTGKPVEVNYKWHYYWQ